MTRSRSPARALVALFLLAGAFAFLALRPSDASAPPAGGGRAFKKVTRVIRGVTDSVAYVTFGAPGSLGRDQTIRCTPNHPFYVQDEGWIGAGDLQPGDLLVGSRDEPVVVRGVEVRAEHAATFNLEVEDFHTYFVAASHDGPAVWVHNDCTGRIAGTEGLEHSYGRHHLEWKDQHGGPALTRPEWQALIEKACESKVEIPWDSRGQPTIAKVARIDGNKPFVVQFWTTGEHAGELATAFIPTPQQLRAMFDKWSQLRGKR